MKTKHTHPLPTSSLLSDTSDDQASPLAPLLERAQNIAQQAAPQIAAPINGLLLGILKGFSVDEAAPLVQIAQFGNRPIMARSATQLSEQDIGRQIALGFENGDIESPIILGLMHQNGSPPQVTSSRPLHIEQDGERTLIEASEELELRCGDAVILLQADGRIQLRGEYITSHASAGQRIRGGSVQIN